MTYELDSSEIIAYLIKHQRAKDNLSISYNKIYELGKKMEILMPSLQVTCDMMSIDAFRCEFSSYVEMRGSELKIRHLHEIYGRILRYVPEPDLELKMNELEMQEK